jgi:superoxide dismutase, Cu-Zn family
MLAAADAVINFGQHRRRVLSSSPVFPISGELRPPKIYQAGTGAHENLRLWPLANRRTRALSLCPQSAQEKNMRILRSAVALSTLSVFAFTAGIVSAQTLKKNGTLVVPIKTSAGADAGTATFKEAKNGKDLAITVKLKGIPFGEHAIHIHQNPTCDAPDFKGAGGHLNPDSKQHGMENPMGHHAGDMPRNISIGEDHTGEITFKVDYLTLAAGAPNSVLGHSIMVHEKADDMKTDPTGNAGNRIACGVISAP